VRPSHCFLALTASLVIVSCESPMPVATRAPGIRSDFAAEGASGWSQPVNLGASINSPGADGCR